MTASDRSSLLAAWTEHSFIKNNFIKKEALALVFSCEFCEISNNTILHRTPVVAASDENCTVSFFDIHHFWDHFYIMVLKQDFQKNKLCKSQVALDFCNLFLIKNFEVTS